MSRPNALWVSDLTHVATWRGFVYVAFVIDAFASGNPGAVHYRRICEEIVADGCRGFRLEAPGTAEAAAE